MCPINRQQANQTIHPYFDADLFFEEQWVAARVVPSSPPVIEFFVRPPNHWHDDDKARVRSHFIQYGLGEKFSVEAAVDIPETIHTRRTTLHDLSSFAFSEYLREKSQNGRLPINNWRRVMFAALAADEWFCAEAFENA